MVLFNIRNKLSLDPKVLRTDVSSSIEKEANFEKEAEPPPPKENGKAGDPAEGHQVHETEETSDIRK